MNERQNEIHKYKEELNTYIDKQQHKQIHNNQTKYIRNNQAIHPHINTYIKQDIHGERKNIHK